MKKTSRIIAAAVLACSLGAAALTGCSSADKGAETEQAAPVSDVTLQVFAANSLEKALPEVQALYTQKTGVSFLDTQFKSSGDLVAELEGGASADFLITASTGTMDKAVDGGYADTGTRTDMFVNELVVIAADGSTIEVADLTELATNPDIASIAIGEPNSVPAGKYALQSFEAAGLVTYDTAEDGTIENIAWDPSIADKMNAGADKVGTVASYVKEGQCDVGLVYSSDLYRYEGIAKVFSVPADMHKKILYPGAVIADSKVAEDASDFMQFCLTDPEALAIWQAYGFELAA